MISFYIRDSRIANASAGGASQKVFRDRCEILNECRWANVKRFLETSCGPWP
jgi:hypothetical protein